MKLPLSWLAEWVDIPWDAAELSRRLTASGFEVEGVEPAAPPFTGVVVAEITAIAPHPDADKLRVCQVNAGGEPLQIVCGAPNARVGLRRRWLSWARCCRVTCRSRPRSCAAWNQPACCARRASWGSPAAMRACWSCPPMRRLGQDLRAVPGAG